MGQSGGLASRMYAELESLYTSTCLSLNVPFKVKRIICTTKSSPFLSISKPVPLLTVVTQHLQPFQITPAQLSASLSMCLGSPIQHDLHSAKKRGQK